MPTDVATSPDEYLNDTDDAVATLPKKKKKRGRPVATTQRAEAKEKADQPLKYADLSANAQAILHSTQCVKAPDYDIPEELAEQLKAALKVAKHTSGVIHPESTAVYALCLQWRINNG